MKFAEIIRLRASRTLMEMVCLIAILFSASPICLGKQKTEHNAVNRLISMVENGESGQSVQAQTLYLSIPADSKCQPVAALAFTLLEIRERQFSDAWKALSAASKDPIPSSDTVKITKERLKLWLLLEANAAEKAQTQFTNIVNMSLNAAPGDPELAANCSFIGSVAGMLETDNESPCIPGSIASRAMEQLLAKVESANAKAKLKEQNAENRLWGTELVAMVRKFESLGQADSEQLVRSTQAELDAARQELMQIRGELKSAGGENRVLEDQRRKWFQSRKAALQEMTRETPGKPQYPVEPGPAPHHPTRPRGHYRVDPKTQEAMYVPPSACDESRYRDELKTYDERAQKWRVRAANYRRDILEYPNKIKLWEQKDAARRASLSDQKQNAELGIASAENEGKHYFSMTYVEGSSLAAKLNDGPLEPMQAASTMLEVSQAVHYAHEQGVIHRDLKPSNILLDMQGRPRVTDFGLAKRLSEDTGMTVSGQVLGTPSYMPPEQAAGQINTIGPASDVYGLGAVLYSLTTGRPPFQSASKIETSRQVVEKEPVAPRQLNTAIPRDLETIILKCLEKSLPRRYATANELSDELQRFIEGRPIVARPISSIAKTWRWCHRQPVVASLIAAVFLSLLAGVSVSAYYAWEANRRAEKEKEAKREESLARAESKRSEERTLIALKAADAARADEARQAEVAKEKSKELRRALYVSDLKQISGLMTTGNVKNTNQFRRPIKCLLLSSKSSCSSRSRGERRAR